MAAASFSLVIALAPLFFLFFYFFLSTGQKTEPDCVWSEIESQNLQESDKNGNRRSMGKINSCLARKQKGVEDCLFLVCLGFSNSSDGKNGEKQPTLHF